jgi:hypothetical protein
MANSIILPKEWTCDGRELKPKSGATSSNTWVFDGKEIKPKSGATSSNSWVWTGTELKPKSGATAGNTWVVNGGKAKPKSGATSSNTFDVGTLPILNFASVAGAWLMNSTKDLVASRSTDDGISVIERVLCASSSDEYKTCAAAYVKGQFDAVSGAELDRNAKIKADGARIDTATYKKI